MRSTARFFVLCLLLACTGRGASEPPGGTVVFVCDHGNVKSLLAASLFEQEAAARHLPVRAVARGVTPEAGVPPEAAGAFASDGFTVTNFQPRRASEAELRTARRVVAINLEVGTVTRPDGRPIDDWSGIPAVSENYPVAREALRARVRTLIDALEQR